MPLLWWTSAHVRAAKTAAVPMCVAASGPKDARAVAAPSRSLVPLPWRRRSNGVGWLAAITDESLRVSLARTLRRVVRASQVLIGIEIVY